MTLVVGPNKIPLTCNKALLAYFSDYFAALCFGHFCEAQTDMVELPEDDPMEIKTFSMWIATGSLKGSLPGQTLERMWVTGKRLLAPEYCNSIIAAIMNRKDGYLTEHTAEDAKTIFEHTSRGGPLHRYITSLVMCGRSHNPWAGPDEDPKSENIIQFENRWMSLVLGELSRQDVAENDAWRCYTSHAPPYSDSYRVQFLEKERSCRSIGLRRRWAPGFDNYGQFSNC
jgi:hypothetical protein